MITRAGVAALTCVAAFFAFGTGSALAVPCVSSTPAAISYADPKGDGEGGNAPDILQGDISLDAGCRLSLTYAIDGGYAVPGDSYFWFINSDNNTATGVPLGFTGADFAVYSAPGFTSELVIYEPLSKAWIKVKDVARTSDFGVSLNLSELNATPGALVVGGGASWENLYDPEPRLAWYDFAPDPSLPFVSLPLAFSGPPVQQAVVRNCVVPNLRGLTYAVAQAKLLSAGCRVGSIYRKRSRRLRGKVINTAPAPGTVLPENAAVAIVIGKKPKKKRRHRRVRRSAVAPAASAAIDRINAAAGLGL